MPGLVSLLDIEHNLKVLKIWRILEEKFNLTGIKITPYPHFSWHVAEEYDYKLLEEKMNAFIPRIKTFTIKTAGLGVFTSELPVLYILIVKDEKLVKLHRAIWKEFKSTAKKTLIHYHPDYWVPHISLAYTDLNNEILGQIFHDFAYESFHWEIKIDNVAYIHEPSGNIGELKYKVHFSK